jgi:hypothetical protein
MHREIVGKPDRIHWGDLSVDGDVSGKDLQERGVRLGTIFIHCSVVCIVGV